MPQPQRDSGSDSKWSISSQIGSSTFPGHQVSGSGSGTPHNGKEFAGSPPFDVLRLSAAQRGIWFAQHLAGTSPISVAQYVEIVGELKPELLVKACNTASREFGSGHVRLIEIDGEPCQFIDEADGSPVSVMDLRRYADPVATAHRLMAEDYSAPLDLLNDFLMKSVVFQVGSDHFLWYLRAHHIALDGYAAVTMLHRITELYNAWVNFEQAPPSTANSLADIIDQDLAYRGSARFDNDRKYWTEHLAGAPPVVSLAGRVSKPTIHPALVSAPLPDETARLLDNVVRERGTSVAPIIVAAFAAYLARMTRSDEVLLSLPVSGRHSAVLRRSGGMVANVVPLRVRVAFRSVGELIAATQSELTSALRRQRYRQEDIFRDMGIARDEAASFGPAVNLMMIENEVVLGDTTGRLNVLTSGPTADLFVNIYPGAGKSSTHIDFQGNPNVYSPEELAGHHKRFLMFVHEFLAGGTARPVSSLPLLEAQERSALVPVRGPSSAGTQLLPDILADSAHRYRSASAIASAGRTLTYGELDTRSSQLARQLIALACGPDTAVAIVLRRSVESIIAAWAVAKCGAAIVQVDPEYPPKRIEHVIADSGARVGITISAYGGRFPRQVRRVVLDDAAALRECDAAADGPIADDERIRPLRASNLAYVTYTSGSTGRPKGVQVTHTGLANLIADRSEAYGVDTTARVSYALSPSFDASMEQFLTCFANGSTLVITPPDVIGGEPLTRLLADEGVTHLTLTPAMLATVDPDQLTELRVVVVGGDVCPPHVIERWMRTGSVYNEYGPTETTVTAAGVAMSPEGGRTVGGPIRGVSAMVLDSALQPVPKGTPGELYLAGPGLARGYSHLFGETAARFVADPYGGPGARIYRTGDIARWASGDSSMRLELLGRSDFQIKIRGYRIEPGEIDAALTGHDDVDLSVTMPVRNNAGATVLASYVVPVRGRRIDPLELERFAGESLPPHMVPAVVVLLDSLPVNSFGKLDRSALPAPAFGTAPVGRPPATPRESLVAGLFVEVLGVRQVGADDSFFALGGDSILSIQLVARAKAAGLAFSTQDVFERKTVAGLAATATQAGDKPQLVELPGRGVGSMPLSPITHAMLERGHFDRFAQAALVELPQRVDRVRLVRALQSLLDRHDMLRAVLCGAESVDQYLDVPDPAAVDADAALVRVRLERRDAAEVDWHLQAAADRLDPSNGVLVQFVWMEDDAGAGPDLMWLVVHHLAVDAVSWRIILSDLAQAWQYVCDGHDPHFGSGTTSVRRWVHGLVEQAAGRRSTELDLWKNVLEQEDQLLGSRHLDPDRDVTATGDRIRTRIPADVAEAILTTIPARFHGSANDPLLAALVLALGLWRRRRGMVADGQVISLEGHGREEHAVPGAELDATVGWFTTRFPVFIQLRGVDLDEAFAGGAAAGLAIKQVKEQRRAVPDNGIGYGMLRRLDPVGRAELGSSREPQISVNYLGRVSAREHSGAWTPTTEFTALTATSDPRMALPAVLDLNVIAEQRSDGIELDATWDFAAQVLGTADVDELAGLWAQALRALARHVRSETAGGFTASDFPLVVASQHEIDRWLREYPSMTDVWPLTALQSGLLFHAIYDDDGVDGYIVQAALTLAGKVHAERMRQAAQALIGRHDSLRTAFVESTDGPHQIVLSDTQVDWRQSDITDIRDAGARERELQRLAAAASEPFDPARPPLVRFHLVRIGADEFQLLVTNHHIVLDGWSMPLLIGELLSLYISEGDTAALAPPRSYRDYLQWLHTRDRDAAITAWRQTLAGIESPTRVMGEPDRTVTAHNGEVGLNLDVATTAAVIGLSRSHGVTANTSMQVAWALLLTVPTGRSDVVFGNTVSDRPPQIPGVEQMVGLFINTVPVRIRLDPNETVADLLVRVQAEQVAMLDHRHIGLAELQRATGLADMFDTVTVLESYPLDRDGLARTLGDAGLRLVDLRAHDATPYPLSLQVTPPRPIRDGRSDTSEPDAFTVTLRFSTDRLGSEDARTLLERFESILTQIVTDPAKKTAAISSCWDSERTELLSARSESPVEELTLREILWKTACRYPDAAAVRCGDTALTYRELARRADELAELLIGRGARPESFVALAIPRSVELVVAIWAVARTGAAFVPLDPDNPSERLAELLSDCRCGLGVTTSAGAPRLPDTVDWLVPDAEEDLSRSASTPAVAGRLLPDHTAYVIYTSGSTGKPKAVQLSHRGLADLVAAQAEAFGADADSVVLQVASPGFDACLSELLLAHSSGACLVVAPPQVYAGSDLADLLRTEKVSHAIITPSVLNTMDPSGLRSLESVAVVGEATGSDTMNRWGHGRRLMNHYGPTECTIWATGSDVLRPGEPVSMGSPIRGVSVAVLDMWLRPVPVGVAGELYIGGPGLARGYFDRPGATASRFVADPVSGHGQRIYRTGDSIRWVRGRTGLELDYLGRNDQQVKIHGLRIELGDIDAHLARHAAVASVATVAQEGPAGEPVLVSYVVSAPGVALDVPALHDDLASTLIYYMNPTAIIELDSMPLTRTGKIDRNALRERAFESESVGGRPPSTPAEQVMAQLFADVLHLDNVSAESNFFTLGGDSILSMRLVALARSAGLDITPRNVFEGKTVAALAAIARGDRAPVPIEEQSGLQAGVRAEGRAYRPSDFPLVALTQSDIERLEKQYHALSDVWPLSPMQSGIHFHSMFDPDTSDNYTVQTMIGFSGEIDAERLRRAAQAVVDRHDILRAAFAETAAGPCQIVLNHAEVQFREVDLADIGDSELPADIGAFAAADAAAGFDLSAPPLIRFTLIHVDSNIFRLLVTNHHVILDGWSMPLLMRDLLEYYGSPSRIEAVGPAPSYRDYLIWLRQQDLAASKAAWAQAYSDVDSPTRVARGAGPADSASAAEVSVELSANRFGQLRAAAADAAVTINTVLAAAWALNLRILTGETEVIFGSAVSGRPPQLPMVDQTLGMFLNTIPVRVRLEPAVSVRELLIRIQAQHASMLDHHYVGLPDIHRSAGVSELFDTALGFQSFPLDRPALQQLVDSAGLHVEDITGIDATPYPLSLVVAPQEAEPGGAQGLQITLRFLEPEFAPARAREILDRFVELVYWIAENPAGRPSAIALNDEPGPLWPPTRDDQFSPGALHEILTASAARRPDAIAAAYGGATLTYRQLDERSNRLARIVLRRTGRPQAVLACALPRSLEGIVAIWAVAKAGAAFVPIDPILPPERVEFLVSDSNASLGLTVTGSTNLPDDIDWLIIDDEQTLRGMDSVSAAPITDSERGGPIRIDRTAYVIYTSGSTGTPKGVLVSHRGLADVVSAQRRVLDVDRTSTVLQVASPSFDASVFELLMAHGSGGRLVVSPPDVYGGRELADLMRREHISHAVLTPSALATVPRDGLAELRVLATAGEPVGPELVDQWAPDRTMVNLYGPTESTIWATGTDALRPGAPITIGRPVGAVAAAVLDTWLRPVPLGVAGELHLFGPGLADGYIGNAGLSAARFVACPFGEPGRRMYRTGDMVRRNPDEHLEFLGRNDFQVKVRGARVELSEIDAALGARSDVAFAVTVPRGDDRRPVTLASYVMPSAGKTVSGEELRAALTEVLPAYMVPAVVMVLGDVPLTSNGKLDRERLPEPVFAARVFRAPSSWVEAVVATAFEQVLHVDRVGVDDDFFALGGDSLSASLVVARVGAALDVRIPVRSLFETPTVGGFAELAGSLSGGGRVPLTAAVRPDPVPLSLAQQRMWFLNRFEPESAVYNIPVMLRLSGRLDFAALGAAIRDVIGRHEVLRTIYPETDGEPRQVILDEPGVTVDPVRVQASSVRDVVGEFVRAGFDVTAQVPMRVGLFKVEPEADGGIEQFTLVLVVHHIAGDGQSMGPLARDVMVAYAARVAGHAPVWQPLAVQYADFALWQRQVLGAADDAASLMSAQLAFWRSTLADAPDRLDLPTDHARPAVASQAGGRVPVEIGPKLHGRLLDLARSRGASLFMVVHAALAVVLARLSGSDDVVIGTPVAGRGEPGLDDLVGMFVNTLALRTPVDGSESFADLLKRTREVDLQAFEHADVPFERVVEELHPERSAAQHPLFQVALAFQNMPTVEVVLPDVAVSRADLDTGTSQFDLQLVISDSYGKAGVTHGISGMMMYARDLFDEVTVTGFVRRLVRVLEAITEDPAVATGDIDWLYADERVELLSRVGSQAAASPVLLPEVLTAAVRDNGDGVAVVSENTELSYTELDERSNRLARHLIRLGAGPGCAVVMAAPRSVESVVAWWAVAKSGAAYVPVDPSYPAGRIEQMVSDSGAVLGVTVSSARAALPDSVDWIVLDDTTVVARIDALAGGTIGDGERLRPLRTSNVAWVVFTSGSTGVPKGVAVTHSGVIGYVSAQRADHDLGPTSRVLHFASTSFDASLLEILLAVSRASALVVAQAGMRGGNELAELLRVQRITHAFVTPAALASVDPAGLDDLRVVMSGGDEVPADLVNRWAGTDISGTRQFRVLYGPTETTIIATATERLRPGDPPTIGAPLPGIQALVLDTRLQPVPVGVSGELYLAGPALARGYVNRAGMSAARFVAHPFGEPGSRVYRTGDVVRWNTVGALEFMGRNDFQVKVRGFRVELGEIDAVLGARAEVAFAVTVPRRAGAGPVMLVSYVAPVAEATVSAEELRAALTEVLPSYMVPAAVMVLDEIPLSPSGKLDRKALPAPVAQTKRFRAPAAPVEEIVAGVFAEVLGVNGTVGADDDFFELGGNSLVAIRAAARIGAALDTNVPVAMIFEAPTVERLAARAESHADTGRVALTAQPRPRHIPLSYAQQRMWFLNRFEPDSPAYNIPIAIRLSGQLHIDALHAAIGDVVTRHEVLRTVYPQVAGDPAQVVLPVAQAIPPMAVTPLAEPELAESVSALVSTAFDVTVEVPFRARLFELEPDEWVLAVVMHHICGDGSSLGPLARDMMIAYAARLQDETPAWPPLPVQYADYSIWQRTVLGTEHDPESLLRAQIDYWTTQLADLPALLELPTDRPRPPTQSYAGASIPMTVDADLHAGLLRIARSHNTTLFMVFHAALAATLARLTGTDDIAIGTPYAGRGEPELDDLVGMFVNTLVLRTRLTSGMSFTQLLEQVRGTDLAAFGHADVPFERLVQELNPVRSQAHHPLFQVMLAFQNLARTDFELPGLSVSAMEADTGTSLFDLQVTVSDTYDTAGAPAGITGGVIYATDLFDPATVTTIVDRLLRLLDAVVADPAQPVGDVDLLDTGEREAVLVQWNSTDHALVPNETLASMFVSSAQVHANRPAMIFGEQSLTYAEFASRVFRLARWLISRGVGPESLVALRMRRSLDQVTAMYAVHAAGGGYIPVDPDYPAERIEYMLTTAAPVLELSSLDGLELSGFDDAPVSDADRLAPLRPYNVAYVLFTSGSTGRPKGVAVSHCSVVNQVRWVSGTYALTPNDVVLQKSPATFDMSVWELFATLAVGARLVIARADGHTDPAYLAETIATQRVTITALVPSMLAVFADAAPAESLESVRTLLVGGEAFGPEVVAAVRRIVPGVELHNLYGPTEFTVCATAHRVTEADSGTMPMGTPVWNARAYVLDNRLHPVPPGVAGELYLAGTQLARGYQSRPGLTAERFVPDPYGDGRRLYRTGDLVRWRRTGELEYLGRTDFQVKLRGLRIELGEIEAVLAEHPGIARAIAVVRSAGAVERLVGYLVPAAGSTIDTGEVLAHAATELPGYMMPTTMVVLDTVPLTASGKLDRTGLPDPVIAVGEFREPSSWLEGEVARAFEQVLGVERVGADDDFYALGGNSLRSVQVVSELKRVLDYEVPVRWMLSDPSPADLAKRIEFGMRFGHDVTDRTALGFDILLPIRTGSRRPPLFCIHPASGLAWCYYTLDQYISAGQPIYGIQAPQIGGEDPGPISIEEIAKRYYDEIRTVQPHGPYHLLGWSLGGLIAHAVAVEMRAAGEQVALLAMLDSEADGIDASSTRSVTPGELISNLGPVMGIDFVSPDATAEQAAELIGGRLGDSVDIDAAMIERLTDTYNLSIRAVGDWQPPVLDSDLLYFTATIERRSEAAGHRGWVPFVRGQISNFCINSTHLAMTEPAAVAQIARILNERLE
ncbi:amino acid adenylation domain-containing protein [Nocardia sp. NBC_00565]|uniref:amino acid adenylation domain-containing protein n=1 Tax=Nocardia sp. NBC_00565 TaxID=2975993 RepID=UPI002E819A0E|nr:amino acid adenylation domain-containing protein [Nocardia sp. NBC_00565]WUC06111.1 amino acid adenylation domain-containing protein [Nocardia sp. NBC_00565]